MQKYFTMTEFFMTSLVKTIDFFLPNLILSSNFLSVKISNWGCNFAFFDGIKFCKNGGARLYKIRVNKIVGVLYLLLYMRADSPRLLEKLPCFISITID